MKQMSLSCLIIISILVSSSVAEFRVNSHTISFQRDAAVAMEAQGNFVVVWNSYGQDGDSGGIFGQRFGASGDPVGSEFQVNTTTTGNQKAPAVAMDNTGNYVVVWHGPGISEEDIFAQRFDVNGQSLGNEFRVNDNTYSKQRFAKVAMNDVGAFVIVWESEKLGTAPYAWVICCRLYDANGLAVVEEFEVNLLLDCRYPDVAMDGNGDFTVVWMQDDDYHTSKVVMVRQYNADGTAKMDPCEVSTIGFNSITRTSIGMDSGGHFVVAWDGDPELAGLDDIHARRYNFNGTAIGEQFVVNATTAGAQQNPKVVINSQREFVIVWNSETEAGSNERDIFGQRYDSLSERLGDEFQVNTYMVSDQRYPAVAMRANGEFVTVWQSDGQDGSEYGIFGEFGPKKGSAELTGDGFVNFRDYCVLAEEWLEEGNPLKADLFDDNKIDGQDLEVFCEQWLTPRYECGEVDINSDSKIDFKDYGLWAGNWSKQGPNLNGDITGEGIVNMADLKALVFHWTQTCE
ncbi:MAG: hypothetical protein ACYS0C_07505 [Planctomycetota bacterium]|jgi:hypothetical protein